MLEGSLGVAVIGQDNSYNRYITARTYKAECNGIRC